MKEALMLALLTHEHIYIEGPPGTGKTFLAELICHSCALSSWFYQMHRDTRLCEIVGESVIVKERTQHGEIIRQDVVSDGILSCELAVLDGISRAPGEALNVLLRILNERKYGNSLDRIPLVSAIATGCAQGTSDHSESLDPATLDRFTFQVRTTGVINEGRWQCASEIMDLRGISIASPNGQHVAEHVVRWAPNVLSKVSLGVATKRALIRLLRCLRDEYDLGESNALLTDRTFLIKAVKALKAKAILTGRLACHPQDLFVMRNLTTFRVPTDVHCRIDQIIAEVLASEDADLPLEMVSPFISEKIASGSDGDCQTGDVEVDKQCSRDKQMPDPSDDSPGEEDEQVTLCANESSVGQNVDLGFENPHSQFECKTIEYDGCSTVALAFDSTDEENLAPLIKAIHGRLEGGNSELKEDPGGMPRRWVVARSLNDMQETDLTGMSLWCSNPSPILPWTQMRSRRRHGGRLVIIRDTSLSMQGPWDQWASLLCTQLVQLAKRHRMEIGYIVFNNDVIKYVMPPSNSFFTCNYDTLRQCVAWSRCQGSTNYEAALETALTELTCNSANVFPDDAKKRVGLHKWKCGQHIVFLTDGYPNKGDCSVARQISSARQAGVAVHTIFLGDDECPDVLDQISLDTDGTRHVAHVDPRTCDIHVARRT